MKTISQLKALWTRFKLWFYDDDEHPAHYDEGLGWYLDDKDER